MDTNPSSKNRPEVIALLQAAKENPDDDAPRLILADWLEEHGDAVDATRAEHIRCQIALHRRQIRHGTPAGVRRREQELRSQCLAEWLGPMRTERDYCTWDVRRGLLHITCQSHLFLEGMTPTLAQSESWAWVEGLSFHFAPTVSEVVRFANNPAFDSVTDLAISKVHDRLVEELASSIHLTRLRRLSLCWGGLTEMGASALVEKLDCPHLNSLWLMGNNLDPGGPRFLASSRLLSGLTSLDLTYNNIQNIGVRALSRSPYLGGLIELKLGHNGIYGDGLRPLLSAPFPKLRRLDLSGNSLDHNALAALSAAPLLAQLDTLNMGGVEAANLDGLLLLLASGYLPDGLSLSLDMGQAGSWGNVEDYQRLAQATGLAKLRSLSLNSHIMGPEGLRILLSSPHLSHLEELNLGYNDLGREGIEVLAAMPWPPRLTRLNLRANDLWYTDIQTLAASPRLAKLKALDLSGDGSGHYGEGVCPKGAHALANSPYLANLQELVLECNELDNEARATLQDSPFLPNLYDLFI